MADAGADLSKKCNTLCKLSHSTLKFALMGPVPRNIGTCLSGCQNCEDYLNGKGWPE